MAQTHLESLLFRIRDGVATAADIERARVLVQSDERLPDELREVVDFTDDPSGDAVGLLAVLGADSLFGDLLREGIAAEIAEAVQPEPEADEVAAEDVDAPWPWSEPFVAALQYEAGEVELAGEVLATLGLEEPVLPLAEAVAFHAGEVEVADAVLAQLGLPAFELPLREAIVGEAGGVDLVARIESELTDLGLPLAEAVRFEAGEVDVADAVLAAVGGEERLPVAEAVRSESGEVAVWDAIAPMVTGAWVSAMLDHELSPAGHKAAARRLHEDPEARELMTAFASLRTELRAAVTEEAGPCPYVWEGVAAAIGVDAEGVEGWDGAVFAEALRGEAGTVDVTNAVMAKVAPAVRMPRAVVDIDDLPVPANRGFSLGTILMMAAAALLILGVPQLLPRTIVDPAPQTAMIVDTNEQFASADEIVVEELDYSDNSNVYQATGDQGALILWVDEGKTL